VISGLKNVTSIYNYFDKYLYLFQGIKKDSYLKFKALNIRIANKEHLNPILREQMILEAEAINPFYVRKSR